MPTESTKAWKVVEQKAKVVLVTAFEPFGTASVNASETILRSIEVTSPHLRTGILPVRKNSVRSMLSELIAGSAPDVIILLGEAGPEEVLRLELVALNHDDFRIPDNDGLMDAPSKIVLGAPNAYFSNIDVYRIIDLLSSTPDLSMVTVSLSAGSFLCNHTYFLARHLHGHIPTVFIHIPCLREESHALDVFERVSKTVHCIVDTITATLVKSTLD